MIAIAALAVLFFSSINCQVINTEVQRTIDLTGPIVKITADIKATNIEKEYEIIFPDSQAKQLAYLTVTKKGKTIPTTAPVSANNITSFSIQLPDSTAALKVVAVFTDLLTPYPSEIGQHDNQLVLFANSHYFLSPYSTQSQKTTLKLSSSQIESYTKLDPQNARGSSIIFGPYKEIGPMEVSPLSVHYVNNKPFAKFSTLSREVEVSHWGNIAVEELYELQHKGAKLKEGFSRFEYMMRRSSDSPAFRSLRAVLPIQANNIYYRDQIGNISTSDIKFDESDGVLELLIETRFPLFGGWQTQFYLGYSIPTEVALFTVEDGRYKLKFDYFTVFEDVWVEDMETKIVLPEGCTDIQVNVPYAVEQTWSRRFTFLDSVLNGGRPVVTLKAKKLVPEHDEKIVVSYRFDKSKMIVEPVMIIACYFLFFLLCTIIVRFDTTKATVVGEKSDFVTDSK
mmetsp:Transcript_16718/g.16817  ORF Transcript_16718/g.16817 Transcript_16718/m.16817 type:complete len:453 (+) Transcript_16718:63-1421(+)